MKKSWIFKNHERTNTHILTLSILLSNTLLLSLSKTQTGTQTHTNINSFSLSFFDTYSRTHTLYVCDTEKQIFSSSLSFTTCSTRIVFKYIFVWCHKSFELATSMCSTLFASNTSNSTKRLNSFIWKHIFSGSLRLFV